MPVEKRSKAKGPSNVPHLGDPDRKRVLNVLAQRRYRQRRREKIAALEAQAKGLPTPSTSPQDEDNVLDLGDAQDATKTNQITLEGLEADVELLPTACEPDITGFDFDRDPFSMDSLQQFNRTPQQPFMSILAYSIKEYQSLPSPIPTSPEQQTTSTLPRPFSPSTLPISLDGAVLNLPVLDAIRAFASIAMAIKIEVGPHLWDPYFMHVLPPLPQEDVASMPSNLIPTTAQMTIPHHPLLDVLPWPTVREKLICMLAMPSCFRPEVARESEDDITTCDCVSTFLGGNGNRSVKQGTAIVQLMQDLDDLRDDAGIRVHGNSTTWDKGNELVEEAWEVREEMYKKWWWCFDQKVIDNSNRQRRERGLGKLKIVSR